MTCLYCDEPLTIVRRSKHFCDSSCRAKMWAFRQIAERTVVRLNQTKRLPKHETEDTLRAMNFVFKGVVNIVYNEYTDLYELGNFKVA